MNARLSFPLGIAQMMAASEPNTTIGHQQSNGICLVVDHDLGPDKVCGDEAGASKEKLDWPCDQSNAARPPADGILGLDRDVQRAVNDERHESHHAGHHGIPVENAGLIAEPEVVHSGSKNSLPVRAARRE